MSKGHTIDLRGNGASRAIVGPEGVVLGGDSLIGNDASLFRHGMPSLLLLLKSPFL